MQETALKWRCCRAANRLARMYRASGPGGSVPQGCQAIRSVYKALGVSKPTLPVRSHFPVHYAPSAKMVPVSLARNGLLRSASS